MDVTVNTKENEDGFWWHLDCAARNIYIVGNECHDTPEIAGQNARDFIRELNEAKVVEVEPPSED